MSDSDNQRSFSIKWLFALVGVCALAAAGLANPSIYWGAFFFSLAILIVTIGFLGAIFAREARRAYWIGFVVLGGGYLMAMYCPGFDRLVGQRLISTKILGMVEIGVSPSPSEETLRRFFRETPRETATNVGSEAVLTLGPGTYPPQWGHFQQVGHSVMVFALAMLGGRVARYFYLSNSPAEGETA